MSLIIGLAALTLHCLPHLPTTPKATDTPRPAAITAPRNTINDDEETITALAAAVFIARAAYREALAMPDPAATLAVIADNLPEVMPEIFAGLDTKPDVAAVILPAVAERVQAFTVVERARTTWDPDYGYVLDVLADGLKKGSDPATVQADVHRIAGHLADMAASR
ncbi:hypothetical protein QF032_003767 [Streptomyces achromogenes]|uniref:hypothetical protein n=1 Tax=Streptomyces achromogenes TaxID=67255 RepID=UPI0027831251|nr:hypothetical protein [Streptomyces achromogenes]MDQ0831923.1 hypothetical protein [Streptomyces achromogenes]